MDYELKDVIKEFQRLQKGYDLWSLYTDFLELMAIEISNTMERLVKPSRYFQRVDRFKTITKKYREDELKKMAEIYAMLTLMQDKNVKLGKAKDLLGSLLMQLELGSKWNGQFFTPDHVADVMAEISLSNSLIDKEIKEKGYILATDPAVGGGVTMIALVNAMLARGFNPQQQLLIECGDLDSRACYMTYIQLSMLGIPAVVKQQDGLTLELYDEWITPFYYLGGRRYKMLQVQDVKKEPEIVFDREDDGQLVLF